MAPRAWTLIGAAGLGLLAIAVLATFAVSVPLPDKAPGAQATKVFSHDGKLIGSLRGAENRTIVPLSAVSPHLAKAVIATEDRDFYRHSGISIRGMIRALFSNVKAGGVTQGGSTITQQYARNAFDEVGRERSVFRKVKEIALSRKIERKFEKDQILEFYLNTVYFGRGAYGAEAASQAYFKKHAKDLTLGEAAYLAGVIRSPHRFQVDEKPEAAVAIRNEVLSDMRAAGMLPEAEATRARTQDLIGRFKLGPTLNLESAKAGYFLEYIRRLLMTEEYGFSESQVLGGGLQIITTLDLQMQAAAEKAISSTLNRPDDPEAAMVAMDTEGRVKAMVGGRDVADPRRARGYNYAANLRPGDTGGRFAGSAFKPFTLA
ncbi:MAG: transglycosylase domain-containing protein, partial [Actinomycetota bacterium]